MNEIFAHRPTYFEGQFLGAEDLAALVEYGRDQTARHALGLHTWGIGAGLELVEVPGPAGDLDVYVLPGYAVDGYGRPVIVPSPSRLLTEPFSRLGTDAIPVWLRFDEGAMRGVRRGFEVCDAVDAFSRMGESFAIEVGPRALLERESGIVVGGDAMSDAREARRAYEADGPLVCDGSVPYQQLSRGDVPSRWLIPLGLVGWQAGAPGRFVALTPAQKVQSRLLRRHAGVVAEAMVAPRGVVRLRDRFTPLRAGQTADDACRADGIQETDLRDAGGVPQFGELIWLEGRVRVTGDARLWGRLELHDDKGTPFLKADGTAGSTPLLVQRIEKNARNGQDLELLIGASADGRNRLSIGQVTASPDAAKGPWAVDYSAAVSRVVVQDDGRVGIGTGAPLSLLHVAHAGHLNAVFERNDNSKEHLTLVVGSEGSGLRFSDSNVFFVASQPFADRADNTFGTEHLRITAAGNVGLGTTAPGQLLTLGAPEGTRLEIARVAASLPWTSGGVLNPGAFAINQQSAGTAAPGADFALMRDGKKRLSLGDVNTYVSSQDNGEILFLINHEEAGALEVMRMTAGGRVGVGTALPAERLDVRGEIRLGANGDFFALGGLQPLRLVAGHVTAAGNLLRGQGFGPIRTNQGQYHVSFSVPFTTPPIVVVAPVDADGEDNLLTVRNLVAGGFDVTARDTTPPNEGDLLDTAFTFVAFGPRA